MSDQAAPQEESKRILCGVLAIVLGGLALHRCVLGDIGGGLLRIVLCFSGFGVISLVEGIIYLTKTDEQFVREYQIGKKAWF